VDVATKKDVRRYRQNLQSEVDSATQYRAMAETEPDPRLASVYRRLAAVEERHIAFWQRQLEEAGEPAHVPRPTLKSRLLSALARRFGASAVVGTVAAGERADQDGYVGQPEASATAMTLEEHAHARVLTVIGRSQRGGLTGGSLARLEGRHRAASGNALRAAVLGANDGLCSNLSLVMGVVGASVSERAVLLTGLSGLIAGACSMALGEWVSVQSARELAEREVDVEARELATDPASEGEELALIYEAKGLSEAESKAVSGQMMAEPKRALDALTREELGIDPQELGGSPGTAAATSFLLFALGAAVPVLPYAVLAGRAAIVASVASSALALFGVGAAIAILTGRSLARSGGRQLVLGLLAAGVTFGVGKLLGVAVGG
jgi:VIT1/CCC1 family predicted Fe2+/Mn2+ transporter